MGMALGHEHTMKPFRLRGPGVAALISASLLLLPVSLAPAHAGSELLDAVKKNPQLAKKLCGDLKALNARNLSYLSPEAVAQVSSLQGLNKTDAEILSTYVVGMYCPEVR